jgi:HEPN domain-containing protein
MKFVPEHYVEAASERIEQAETLFRIRHYSLAMDTAGRAVECILRAYFFRKHGSDAKLEAAHDIIQLFQASGLKAIALEAQRSRGDSETKIAKYSRDIQTDIGRISQMWSNDLRYASENRLRADLRRQNLHQGVKGDYLKFNAQRLIEAARRIVDVGVERWKRSKRK